MKQEQTTTEEPNYTRSLVKVDNNTYKFEEVYKKERQRSEKYHDKETLKGIHGDLKVQIRNHKDMIVQTKKELEKIHISAEREEEIKKFLELSQEALSLKKRNELNAQLEYSRKNVEDLEYQKNEIEKAIPELTRSK